MSTQRKGILAAGNFIVNHVKIMDDYPQQDMLASIVSESQSNGGGPYNVLKCLAVSLAASSLADPAPSAAILPVHECLGLSERFGFGPFGQAA
jgi:hypothetical protein